MFRGSGLVIALVLISFLGIGSDFLGYLFVGLIFLGIPFLLIFLFSGNSDPDTSSDLDAPLTEGVKPSPEHIAISEKRGERWPLIDEWVNNLYKTFPECGPARWEWADHWTTKNIILETRGSENLRYVGTLSFAEPGDDDYYDQPRVTGYESVIEGTDIKRSWKGTELSRIPLSSIKKNIANSFKNDKKLRKVIEEAFSNCLEVGSSIIELDDIDLDFSDKRVIAEFSKACLSSGNFSDVHLLSNGHQLKAFVGDADPV